MLNKVIFFIECPFGRRDYERFGVGLLRDNGFDVRIWDFTPFLHPEAYQAFELLDPLDDEKKKQFLSEPEALSEISRLSQECFVVCLIEYCLGSLNVYKAVSSAGLKYCVMLGAVPYSDTVRKNGIGDILRRLKDINAPKIKNRIFNITPYRFLGVTQPAFILAGGGRSLSRSALAACGTEVLWLHALDYDIYLSRKDAPLPRGPAGGLFLDENVVFHPDYHFMQTEPFSSAQDYYPALRRFFDLIEKGPGAEIAIAAHPSSRYDGHPEYFGHRPVFKGKTLELVKSAGFVIAHCSTSIGFAVLYKKPVVIITTDSLQRSMQGPWIEAMAKALNKRVVNIDKIDKFDLRQELSVDQAAYARYKNDYIKKDGTPERFFWQGFLERIRKI